MITWLDLGAISVRRGSNVEGFGVKAGRIYSVISSATEENTSQALSVIRKRPGGQA